MPTEKGWYPDPHGSGLLRWFDGEAWTDARMPGVALNTEVFTAAPAEVEAGRVGPLGIVAATAIVLMLVLVAVVTYGPSGVGAWLSSNGPFWGSDAPSTARNTFAATVRVVQADQYTGTSGTAVAISDHVLLTAAHVVAGKDHATVMLPGGDAIDAAVVAFERPADLALLRTSEPHGLPVARVARADPPVGASVQAIGAPDHYVQASSGMVTGVADYDRDGFADVETDAAVRHGNSGGPLVNDDDEIVGLVSYRLGSERAAYAVSAEEIRSFLSRANWD